MQYEFNQPSASGSKDTESGLEDDEAMAKHLAEEWVHKDESTNLKKHIDELPMDIEGIYPGPSHNV
jgi:hypothetical protein